MTLFLKLTAFLGILLIAQVLLSLSYDLRATGEADGPHLDLPGHLRVSVPDPDHYNAPPEVAAVQTYQRTNPIVGFAWQPSIDTSDGIVISWGDAPPGVVSTDEFGFVNSTAAIAQHRSGTPVDIVGLGASYMGGAQATFFDYFDLKGLFYYNLGQGRYTVPQFNAALQAYALPLKPKWIVYGLDEVSFLLIDDFEGWKRSGMDWFSYHGGSWCGPPRKSGFPHDQLHALGTLPHALYCAVERKVSKKSLVDLSEAQKRHLVDATRTCVLDAYHTACDNDIGFILLLIPSKTRMTSGPTAQNFLFERVVPDLQKSGMTIVDLREPFAAVEDPRSLYFAIDSHWNRHGVYIAAQEILRAVRGGRP
jgi:hypothetical protein